MFFFFCFSSSRRHTRLRRDWSSDVCSSDLGIPMILLEDGYTEKKKEQIHHDHLIKDFIGIEKIVSSYLND